MKPMNSYRTPSSEPCCILYVDTVFVT